MSIWLTKKEQEQEEKTNNKPEYTDKQLKKMVDEYLHNQISIKHLIKNEIILSKHGQEKYRRIKSRQEELRKILTKNGVKP